jgi:hypothetical protein
MRTMRVYVCLAALCCLASAGSVWPRPKSIDVGETRFRLASKNVFSFQSDVASTTLWLAFARYRELIFNSPPQVFSDGHEVDGVLDTLYVHVCCRMSASRPAD